MLLHEEAEETVVIEPGRLLFFELFEFLDEGRSRLLEAGPSEFQQTAFGAADSRVIHAFGMQGRAHTLTGFGNVFFRQPRDFRRG